MQTEPSLTPLHTAYTAALWRARLLHALPFPKPYRQRSRDWLWLIARHHSQLQTLPDHPPPPAWQTALTAVTAPLAAFPALLPVAAAPHQYLAAYLQNQSQLLENPLHSLLTHPAASTAPGALAARLRRLVQELSDFHSGAPLPADAPQSGE